MADNLLTMDQYEEVKKILWPVRVQYKKLYIALGGNPAKLTTKTAKNDMDTTYYNILEMCLKKENISQDDVARALTSIGYGYLSDNVTSLKLQDLTEDGKKLSIIM